MRNVDCKEIRSGIFKRLTMMLYGLVALVTAGCGPGSGDGVIIAVLPFEGSLVLEADYTNTGQATGGFVFNFGPLMPRPPVIGADISAYQSLKFSIDTSALANFANLTIRLESPGVVTMVNLADYVPRVTGSWSSYAIPLSVFQSQGLDLTNTIYLGFWDARDNAGVLVFGKLFFDDIYFEDAAGTTLGVYSETNTNPVLNVSEIINGDDPQFGGNTTDTKDSLNALTLPTDTLLNLACIDVGINTETCILGDPENLFTTAVVNEFDPNNPTAQTKFELNDLIPAGPTGAKARFYLWGTALARRPSGENQWYTARALHELWDAAGDPLVQAQALKAYRSVLDNFFGSVTFFVFGTPPNEIAISAQLNLLVGDDLYRPAATGFATLFPSASPALSESLTLDAISFWGYTYIPCVVNVPPDVPPTCPNNGFMFKNVP